MEDNLAQNPESWGDFWDGRTPYHELRLRDTYSERPYVLKYVPRFGTVIEAGSGLGRVAFYLEKIGIDIVGVDFSKRDLCQCRGFARKHGFTPERFIHGDIIGLPFKDDSCAGYLSFGVVEHFVEGPQVPLKEAFRVLKPGGILILTTPNRFAIHRLYGKLRGEIKYSIKKAFYFFRGKKLERPKEEFWQYWYSKDQLRNFTEEQGFRTIVAEAFGLKHACDWLIRAPEFRPFLISIPLVMKFVNFLERGFFRNFSASSIVVSYKPGTKLNCFFSGSNLQTAVSPDIDVPISKSSLETLPSNILNLYTNGNKPFFAKNRPYSKNNYSSYNRERNCFYCTKNYTDDDLVGLSFSRPVCLDCLKKKNINFEVTNSHLEEKWLAWK